jgi:uncharacterized protein (TIGR02246 family)
VRSLTIAALLVFSQATFALQAVTEKDITALFDQWNQSLQTGKSEEVVKNYAPDAILLPTVSNQVRHNHDEIKSYFEHFLAKKPVGKLDEQNIRLLSDDVAVNSGVYTFTINHEEKTKDVQARYTFVYRKIGDKWLIVEHHSSAMPEKSSTVKH